MLGNIKDRRLVVYALVTPRATRESISGRFLINDFSKKINKAELEKKRNGIINGKN